MKYYTLSVGTLIVMMLSSMHTTPYRKRCPREILRILNQPDDALVYVWPKHMKHTIKYACTAYTCRCNTLIENEPILPLPQPSQAPRIKNIASLKNSE